MRSTTKLDNGSAERVKLVDKADVRVNIYSCIDTILAQTYNSVNLCKYSIEFAIKMTLNCEKITNIAFQHTENSPLLRNLHKKLQAGCAS